MARLNEMQFRSKGALIPFLKKIFSYSFKYKRLTLNFIFFIILVAVTDAVFPIIWMQLIDKVVVPFAEIYTKQTEPNIDFAPLTEFAFYYFAIGMLQAFAVFMFIKFTGFIQEQVMFDIREELFVHLQKLPFAFYDKMAVGWLMSRITSDTDRVSEVISWGFIEVIWGTVMIIVCSGVMFFLNWKLALIVLSSIPVLLIVSFKIKRLILDFSRQARKLNSEITASYNEHINGVEVNKSTVQEKRAGKEFSILSEKMRVASFNASFYTALYQPLVIFIGSVAAAVVVFIGGKMSLGFPPEITIGVLTAFFSYAVQIYEPIFDISGFYAQVQGSISAGERIFSLLETPTRIFDEPNVTDFKKIEGEIDFENVSFSYDEGKPVLENFSLKIKKGTSVALVGATGSGKSTIASLVCRFYEATAGKVKIDGIDYKTKTLFSLRSQLGIVLQTPHLFSGTIKQNIQYSRENATEDEIKNALRLVGAENFLGRLEEEVGECGINLSMGEKQLVSFARAILSNPGIFVMDEATSSIDTITEAKIQRGIEELVKGRTSIIIAHRLSTIKNCDRILVIQKGKIIEDGSHFELMKNKGNYYNLYTRQLRTEKEKEHGLFVDVTEKQVKMDYDEVED
ncbi:ABC transporter ATP-binding protein [bacterium]|nr:ABC transporter ATP-binding protein [bacterium]